MGEGDERILCSLWQHPSLGDGRVLRNTAGDPKRLRLGVNVLFCWRPPAKGQQMNVISEGEPLLCLPFCRRLFLGDRNTFAVEGGR